jgi:hypothetical protein
VTGRLGTCCEIVAARDKKKGDDIDDDQGGGTISCRESTIPSFHFVAFLLYFTV